MSEEKELLTPRERRISNHRSGRRKVFSQSRGGSLTTNSGVAGSGVGGGGGVNGAIVNGGIGTGANDGGGSGTQGNAIPGDELPPPHSLSSHARNDDSSKMRPPPPPPPAVMEILHQSSSRAKEDKNQVRTKSLPYSMPSKVSTCTFNNFYCRLNQFYI